MKSKLPTAIVVTLVLVSAAAAQETWYAKARAAVVRIEVFRDDVAIAEDKADAVGTGFLYGDRSTVVTAFHLVAGAKLIKAGEVTATGPRTLAARIDRVGMSVDLAVLELYSGESGERVRAAAEPLVFAPAEQIPKERANLSCIGFHLGVASPSHIDLSVTHPLAALRSTASSDAQQVFETLGFPSVSTVVIQLQGALNPGHSGAPVFDASGKVVAIVSGGEAAGKRGIAWAVPAALGFELIDGAKRQSAVNLTRHEINLLSHYFYAEAAAPRSGAVASDEELQKWRQQLVARYRLFADFEVSGSRIDRLVRLLGRCPREPARNLMARYQDELPWRNDYRDGIADYKQLFVAAEKLVSSSGYGGLAGASGRPGSTAVTETPADRAPGVPPAPASKFTVRYYYGATSGANITASKVRLTLNEMGFGAVEPLSIKGRKASIPKSKLHSRYVNEQSLASLNLQRDRLVIYPREAKHLVESLREEFPRHRFQQRSESSKQFDKEGESTRYIIDIVGKPGQKRR